MTSVFFFKQNTAYDMRISDWSSDVCSSDLALGAHAVDDDFSARRDGEAAAQRNARRIGGIEAARAAAAGQAPGQAQAQDERHRDRKRGVWGKSVSVRLSTGGVRDIKKNRKIRQTEKIDLKQSRQTKQ